MSKILGKNSQIVSVSDLWNFRNERKVHSQVSTTTSFLQLYGFLTQIEDFKTMKYVVIIENVIYLHLVSKNSKIMYLVITTHTSYSEMKYSFKK